MKKVKYHQIWYYIIPDLAQAEVALDTLNVKIQELTGKEGSENEESL